nr:hypothetical protein [Lacticaseibacillus manihotivorans]
MWRFFYTFGPVPLSRIPSGEFLAGMCEGFGTIFIAVFVNIVPQPMTLSLTWSQFRLGLDMAECLQLLLVALPIVILDGTVMFADNICDLDQDQRNQRFTLPYYLGKPRALKVYPWLPRIAFLMIVVAVLLRALPWLSLLTLLLWPLVAKNTAGFMALQDKRKTFNLAIKTLLTTAAAEVVLLLVAGVLNF